MLENNIPKRVKNIQGEKFNKLTAVKFVRMNSWLHRSAVWLFKCDCGNETEAVAIEVKRGLVRMCRECAMREKGRRSIGERFGNLTLLQNTGKLVHSTYIWQCRCDCGNICEFSARKLSEGAKQCYECKPKIGVIKDITGQKFGKLTAVKKVGSNKYFQTQWLCQCDCGGQKIALSHLLKSGDVKGCKSCKGIKKQK